MQDCSLTQIEDQATKKAYSQKKPLQQAEMQSYSNFLALISNTPRVILDSKSRVHKASFSDKQFVDLQYLHECPNENTALQL